MNIADRIQHLRKVKGISQEELADKVGVSRQAVSKWESEQGQPEITNIIKLSEFYNVTTDYLLVGKVENNISNTVQKENLINSKAVSIIVVIGATALITVGFITLLGLLGKFVL